MRLSNMSWTDKLTGVAKGVQMANKEQYILDPEDLTILEPLVLDFYNNPKGGDTVFQVGPVFKEQDIIKKGSILLVRTGKGKIEKMDSYYNDRITLKGCTFKFGGEDLFFSPWLLAEQWQQVKDKFKSLTDVQFFVHGNLNAKYHKTGDLWKADDPNIGKRKVGGKVKLTLEKFIARFELDAIEQINKSDYQIFYETNAFKVFV